MFTQLKNQMLSALLKKYIVDFKKGTFSKAQYFIGVISNPEWDKQIKKFHFKRGSVQPGQLNSLLDPEFDIRIVKEDPDREIETGKCSLTFQAKATQQLNDKS